AGEFPRVAGRYERYVLLTNIRLSAPQVQRIRDAIIGSSEHGLRTRIVIWGAAEVATAINLSPFLRHLFFSQGGLCTLDFAEQELKSAYQRLAWPDWINRDGEISAVRKFATTLEGGVLQIIGPHLIGKTRLAIEALRPSAALVVWASSPEYVTLELVR